MSTDTDELRSLVADILADPAGGARPSEQAWERLAAGGLVHIALPEEVGGSGGTLEDAAAVLATVAGAGVAVPLLETAWLTGWLDAQAGRALPGSTSTLVIADDRTTATRDGDGWLLADSLPAVPWWPAAGELRVVLPSADLVVTVTGAADLGTPVVGVPRGPLRLPVRVAADQAYPLPAGAVQELRLRHALGRSVQVAGGCRAVLDTAVRYAGERVQFGRPLSRNQVIQHYLARIASTTHGVDVAARSAVAAYQHDGLAATTAVHAAKAVASTAVAEVTALAHQVLGAIGTTQEHPLHRLTMALWDWREDGGDEFRHAADLADLALAGDGDVWEFLAPAPAVGS